MTDFFGPASPYLAHPLLTVERTRLEVGRILEISGAEPIDVLDVGCGFGRHAVEFAAQGMAVVAVDPSVTMLEAARTRAAAEGVSVDFRQLGAREIDDRSSFDLVVCLFTTLGQIIDPRRGDESERVVESMVRALRPGGTLVVEVPERRRTSAGLVRHERLGNTAVTRSLDPAGGQVEERFDTGERVFELRYRLFDRSELQTLLRGFDLEIVNVLDEALVTPPDNLMTFVARRT